jgi:hypothetical protein
VPPSSYHSGSKERDSAIPLSEPRALNSDDERAFERKKWRCPLCRRRFRVLADHFPEVCPDCRHHLPQPPEQDEKSKILIEPTDPFVEFISRLTGHRFSPARLIRSAIVVAIMIAAVVIGFAIIHPFWSVKGQLVAPANRDDLAADELLTRFATTVSSKMLEPESTPIGGSVPRDHTRRDFGSAPHNAPVISVSLDDPHTKNDPGPNDQDLLAARAWIRSNQDQAVWQELRWWPATVVDDDLVAIAGLQKSDRVARLKYGLKNEHGTQIVRDDIFVYRDNKVRAVPRGDNWWWDEWGGWTGLIIQGARRLLPDGDDVKIPRLASVMKSPTNMSLGKASEPNSMRPTKGVAGRPLARAAKKDRGTRAQRLSVGRLKKKGGNSPWWTKYADEADADLIRTWLNDNLQDCEEVRWWKPRDLIAYGWSRNPRREAVLPLEDRSKRFQFLVAGGMPPDRTTREHVVRIKIRVNSQTKNAKIEDRLFVVDKGRVEPIIDPDHKRHEWKYFPDAAGAKPLAAE